MTDLFTEFEKIAAHYPENVATIEEEGVTTVSQLLDRGRALAVGLSRLGVGRGDRVGVWLPNITAYLEIVIACARIGAIVVSVNTKFKSVEVEDIVGRSGCKALFLWPGFRDLDFLQLLADIDPAGLATLETLIFYDEGQADITVPAAFRRKNQVSFHDLYSDGDAPVSRCKPEDGLVIFTTSGTTGKPKFVLHSHRSVTEHAKDMTLRFDMADEKSVILQALPLCGTFGLAQAMAGLLSASTMILMPVFDGDKAARYIQRQQVSHMNGSDDMMAMMLDAVPEPFPFPSLRSFGFAAFNPALQDIVSIADQRGVKMTGLWGMSEVQAFVACQPVTGSIEQRSLAGGKLTSARISVRVRNCETGELCDIGEPGEIECRSVGQMLEYFGNPEATRETITLDGYVKTGDLGYMQSTDSFVFLSRMGDVLRLGGFLVSPAEIEECLQSYPTIERAQVVGVETETGARAVAFVIEKEKIDPADVIAHVGARLARFKTPVAIFELDEFPTTDSANGVKIQRSVLKTMAAEKMQKKQF